MTRWALQLHDEQLNQSAFVAVCDAPSHVEIVYAAEHHERAVVRVELRGGQLRAVVWDEAACRTDKEGQFMPLCHIAPTANNGWWEVVLPSEQAPAFPAVDALLSVMVVHYRMCATPGGGRVYRVSAEQATRRLPKDADTGAPILPKDEHGGFVMSAANANFDRGAWMAVSPLPNGV